MKHVLFSLVIFSLVLAVNAEKIPAFFLKANIDHKDQAFGELKAQLTSGKNGESLELSAYTPGKKARIVLTIDVPAATHVKAGEYKAGVKGSAYVTNIIYNTPEEFFQVSNGTVSISELKNGSIKGVFSGTLLSGAGKKIDITNGSFALPLSRQ
jgi:hypothetical protein